MNDSQKRFTVFFKLSLPNPGKQTKFTGTALDSIIKKFDAVRKNAVRKPPATAELIAWLKILEMHEFLEKDDVGQRDLLLNNLSVLVKTKEDLEAVKGVFG